MTNPRSPLSEADLHRLRARLTKKRDDLLAARRSSEAEVRDGAERHAEAADGAEAVIEQEAALRVVGFDAALLAEVERALRKIEDGSYGLSEDSGAPIPLARLEALPWARRTAQEEERHRGSRR